MAGRVKERLKTSQRVAIREIEGLGPVQIRKLSTDEVLAMADETDTKRGMRRLVAAALVEADGSPVLTEQEVGQLEWDLCLAIANAATEVNRLNLKDAAKN